jgi:hypothetical protein
MNTALHIISYNEIVLQINDYKYLYAKLILNSDWKKINFRVLNTFPVS